MGRIIKRLTMKRIVVIFLNVALFATFITTKAQTSIRSDAGFCLGSIQPISGTTFDLTQGLAVADFNGDAYKDIVYLRASSTNYGLQCFRNDYPNNGSHASAFVGNFVPPSFLCGQFDPEEENALTAGDFNGDGKPDLAIVDDIRINILLNTTLSNTAAISFSCGASYSLTTTNNVFSNENYLDAVDFNGDGFNDLIVIGSNVTAANNEVLAIEFFKGNGSASFTSLGVTTVTTPSGIPVENFAEFQYQIVDYDKDGRLDYLMNIQNTTGQMLLLKNTSVGNTFSIQPILLPTPIPVGSFISAFQFTDLNADTYNDLVVTAFDGIDYNTISFLNSVTTPSALPAYNVSQSSTVTASFDKHFIVEDFNNDGKKDFYGNSGSNFKLVKGDNSPLSYIPTTINMLYGNASVYQLKTADFDNDGLLDMVSLPQRGSLNILDVIFNFSYNPILNPSNLNIVLCNGGSLPVSVQFTPTPIGFASINYTWIENGLNVISTTSTATISTSGFFYSKVNTTLTTNASQACLFSPPIYTLASFSSPVIVANITPSAPCAGSTATVNLSGGVNYTVNGTALPLASSVYTFVATNTLTNIVSIGQDANTCSGTTINNLLISPQPTLALASSNASACPNSVVSFSATSFYPPQTFYSWNGSPFSTLPIFTISATASTVISLAIKTSSGCLSPTITQALNVLNVLPIGITGNSTVCANANATFTFNAGSTYSFNPPTGITSANTYSIFVPPSGAQFSVTAIDNNNCANDSVVLIKTYPDVTEVITASNTKVCQGNPTTLSFSGNYTFDWLQFGGSTDPSSITVSPTVATTYSLVVTDITTSCAYLKTVSVDIDPTCTISISNALTPNNDNVNDVFLISNIEKYPNNTVSIYNRYGVELSKIKGYNNASNSWPREADVNKLNAGTYFYVIELGDNSTPLKGWVEVLKN